MIAAVFDLDRTLLPGTTAERLFLRQLIRNRVLGPSAGIRTLGFVLRSGLRDAVQRMRADRPYLTGLHEATLQLEGRTCARETIRPRLSPRGLGQLEWHRRMGHHLVLLSGSLPYVVEPLREDPGFDHVICSRLETRRQRLCGRLRGLHPYGEAKATLIEAYARCHGLDLPHSYCYADHHTDAPMLQLFGYPICVNPSDELKQIAEKSGWPVEAFCPGDEMGVPGGGAESSTS